MEFRFDDPMEGLYRSQHERLWKSLFAFSSDRELATEAAAEAFSQTVSRGDNLHDPAAWLWRTAFKIVGGLLANKRTEAQQHVQLGDGWEETSASLHFDKSLNDFFEMLKGLSEQQRAIVALRYAGGFSANEIAELLDSSPGSVRVQLHRAHEILRERINPNERSQQH